MRVQGEQEENVGAELLSADSTDVYNVQTVSGRFWIACKNHMHSAVSDDVHIRSFQSCSMLNSVCNLQPPIKVLLCRQDFMFLVLA